MVIVSKDWMENVEDTKPVLDPNTIMASPAAVTSNENTIRNDWKQQVQSTIIGTQNNRTNEPRQCARAVLYCQPNSHPFQTRTLLLEPQQEVKVGRSIARNRVSENNAIFDCKVLSRNHAVIWYCDGKFYVKDTKSSNGTFINERRISQSEPEELHFGDIIKFGVDVIENSRKEVHGCIIASVKLYLPDGRELISNSTNRTISGEGIISLDELHRLHHYMQESVQREKILEIKLHEIQKIIEVTRKNTSTCWQAMIDEDRLLNRIDILENKLQFFQKNAPESSLREEILKLQDDKYSYQNSAKEALRKVYQERMDAMQKLSTIERALCSSEDECSLLRDQLLQTQQNLQDVNARLIRFETECKEYQEESEKAQNLVQKQDAETQKLYAQLNEKGEECEEYKNQVYTLMVEMNALQKHLNVSEKLVEDSSDAETLSTKDITRGTVMKWLENSDLKNKVEGADIIRAICNDIDENDDNHDLTLDLTSMYNKLISFDLHISQWANDVKTDGQDDVEENSTNLEPTFNNGNSDSDLKYKETIKTSVSTLMEIYNELFHTVSNLKGFKENLEHREKNVETKLSRLQDELDNLRIELEARPTYNQFQEKISLNEALQNNIEMLKLTEQELQQHINKLSHENQSQKESHILMKSSSKNNIGLQTEFTQILKELNDKSSSNELETSMKESRPGLVDDLLDNDLELLNDSTVQQEEELIIFKEKYERVTIENFELKETIAKLEHSTSDVQKSIATRYLLGGALVVIFVSYVLACFLNL